MTRSYQLTSRSSFKLTMSLAGLLLAAVSSTGCGDGMLGWDWGGDETARVQQAQAINGRYRPPADVAEAGREQAGNITYDDADQCIGTGNPILPGADRLASFLRDNFDGASRYDHTVYCRSVRGGSSLSMHATGRAIDLYIPTIGERADNTAGDPVANYLIRNATQLGVQYFIWDKTQFNTSRGYTEDYCKNRCWEHGGGKHPHHDHLHIELTKYAANHLDYSDIPPVDGSSGGYSIDTPDAPQTLSPANNKSVWTDDVTLSAEQVSGAYRYAFDIERYDGSGWESYYTYETDSASKRFWPASKAAYRWRVRVTTAGGTSEYSDWSTFWFGISTGSDSGPDSGGSTDTDSTDTGSTDTSSTDTDTAPTSNAPTGAWPTGGEQVTTSSVTLQVDQVSGAYDYEFDVQAYAGGLWVDYYTYDPDVSSKEFWPYYSDVAYRWRARARTASGWTDYTDWNVFLYGNATHPNAPAQPTSNAPTGLSPANNQRVWTDSVTVSCDDVGGASRYEFEVQYHDGQVWREYYTYEPSSASKKFWPYIEDNAYRVRARAYTSSGWTDYSGWNVFLYGNASTP
ncbi:hypothetical protein FIV42_16310 [Persicimonas caeni]|uniref:ARB-07466-like C-terminal domain-containing protein n=1 Tax=Persicimonas caeni TaxID=2292766 RepID=A0A4Y6PV63_PERCE|nr:hypothetical protein [Persicimonas caeni]QDG52244.1 hypothetical protein FIV42_16310 [Persicimonas caeni]QED33466.1 hypothetical protein FRD00_16305 [Persicimonas caeni]